MTDVTDGSGRPPPDEDGPVDVPPDAATDEQAGILASSAVMAAGTVVSRASGFVRSALLAAALGASLHADVFTIANTIPNMLYILLAGGVFNAVLVPQLVRAQRTTRMAATPTPTGWSRWRPSSSAPSPWPWSPSRPR